MLPAADCLHMYAQHGSSPSKVCDVDAEEAVRIFATDHKKL